MKIISDLFKTFFYFLYHKTFFEIMKLIAKRKHNKYGKRYHVVPKGKLNLIVVDNTYLKKYNKAAIKNKQKTINFVKLMEMSYYSTPKKTVSKNNKKSKLNK